MSPQEEIEAANRVKVFLADPAVQAAIKKADAQAYAAFKDADSEEKRHMAWARSKALNELQTQLQVTIDTGNHAAHQAEQNNRKVSQQRGR